MQNNFEEIIDDFDGTFGTAKLIHKQECKDGKNCGEWCFEYESNGRDAGCDGCEINIKLREEHKQFLLQSLTKIDQQAREEEREKVIEEIKSKMPEEMLLDYNMCPDYPAGFNQARKEILEILNNLK